MITNVRQTYVINIGRYISLLFTAVTLSACSVQNEDVCTRVRKLMPFPVSKVSQQSQDAFRFECETTPDYEPDYYMKQDKSIWVSHTSFDPIEKHQPEDEVWRNLDVDKKHKRILCIDRVQKSGKTTGYVYILESEQKNHILDHDCSWDVTDPRNMESAGSSLDGYWKQTWQKVFGIGIQPPLSQEGYWRLIFHTDSINNPSELKVYYDAAFTEDRYVLPIHLTMAAKRMLDLGDTQSFNNYLEHRIRLEADYYEDSVDYLLPQTVSDKFRERKQKYNYDIKLKKELEEIFEKDQHYRMQWNVACNDNKDNFMRNETLRARAWNTDKKNLARVDEILSESGYPSKSKVGKMASLTVWAVIQHADIDTQTKYLNVIEQAASEGNVPMMFVAMLRDRIDVREGRPQKYGTQYGTDDKLCPLLDASKVNLWRSEVGLPPIDSSTIK